MITPRAIAKEAFDAARTAANNVIESHAHEFEPDKWPSIQAYCRTLVRSAFAVPYTRAANAKRMKPQDVDE